MNPFTYKQAQDLFDSIAKNLFRDKSYIVNGKPLSLSDAIQELTNIEAMNRCSSIMREFAIDKRNRADAMPASRGERVRALYADASLLDGFADEIEVYINSRLQGEN